jgi:hypothetical protein
LRNRSPFRFRSKDAVIIEHEPSPPPPPPPPPPPAPKETKQKVPVPPSSTKQRGRLVELKKTTVKPTSSNGTPRKVVNVIPITDPNPSTLVRRASGLKDLIHKFDTTPAKPKRVGMESVSSIEINQDEPIQSDISNDEQQRTSTKAIDIPDLLQNVEKDPTKLSTRSTLRHSNSSRQTASFDSNTSMVSATESIITTSSGTRKPTSTARPLMLSTVS